MLSLPLIWMGIIAFSLLLYVILDGFTLGIGMLFPWMDAKERDLAVSSILPTWDGNQTWLVFALAAFYGMFPIGFSFLFPKIYLPAILLALMLLFRGICFEFRLKSHQGIRYWDTLFCFASFVITLIHGYLAGQLIVGYHLPHYASGLLFKLLTAVVLVVGYMLLGSTRLILKTEGDLQAKMRKKSMMHAGLLILGMMLVGLFTFIDYDMPKWDTDKFIGLALFASFTLLFFLLLPKAIFHAKKHYLAYWASVGIFVSTFLSMVVYIYPYIIPYELTYLQAKADPNTMRFTLIAAVFMIPLLLLYTGYAYYVFRGKTTEKLHY